MAILALLSLNTYSQDDKRGYLVRLGQMAPDFTVSTADGKVFRLSENRGKIIMLQFTASWCSVCRKEMPHIENEIWQVMKNKNFILLGIDREEPFDVVKDFARDMKITYPLAIDPGAAVFSLFAEKNAGVTRNVIIDGQGKIVFLTRLYDNDEFEAMKKKIKELVR